jgi:DNA end-binding protein Ku
LRELIEAKLKKGDALDTDETFGETAKGDDEGGGEVLDLMEALRRSVESSRGATKQAGGKSGSKSGSKSTSKSGSKSSPKKPAAPAAAETPKRQRKSQSSA